jgi:hypothetical protein
MICRVIIRIEVVNKQRYNRITWWLNLHCTTQTYLDSTVQRNKPKLRYILKISNRTKLIETGENSIVRNFELQGRQASISSLKHPLAFYLTLSPIILWFYSRSRSLYTILPFVPMHYINYVINQVSRVRQHFLLSGRLHPANVLKSLSSSCYTLPISPPLRVPQQHSYTGVTNIKKKNSVVFSPLVNYNLKIFGSGKSSRGLVKVIFQHLHGGTGENHEPLNRDSQCSGRDSNSASPGYKSRLLHLDQPVLWQHLKRPRALPLLSPLIHHSSLSP